MSNGAEAAAAANGSRRPVGAAGALLRAVHALESIRRLKQLPWVSGCVSGCGCSSHLRCVLWVLFFSNTPPLGAPPHLQAQSWSWGCVTELPHGSYKHPVTATLFLPKSWAIFLF